MALTALAALNTIKLQSDSLPLGLLKPRVLSLCSPKTPNQF